MKGYKLINLNDMLSAIGEDNVKTIFSDFYCSKNADIEYFLKCKSFEFCKLGSANTFLVFASYQDKPFLLGYFAIATKFATIPRKSLSSNLRGKLYHFSKQVNECKEYEVSLPLIAQLAKNDAAPKEAAITGDELLKMACDKVKEAQMILGGKFVFLECEDVEKLEHFYQANGFVTFGKRERSKDEANMINAEYFLQMIKYLK